ncbi:MAG: DUF192 domain-containing protein [Nitriliruptoraceae bacterium]
MTDRAGVRPLAALWLALALWACGPVAPTQEASPDEAGTAPDVDAPPGSPTVDAPPESPTVDVPPLHPAVDGLPATTVVLEGSERVEVAARVASDDAGRRRGLMEVEDLPDGEGMLFLFEEERTSGFWMWNTRIPLDIAFAGLDGTVHTIATMVPCEASDPGECPITAPEEPYVTALEVPAGWFDRVGIGPGSTLRWSEPQPPGS